MLIEHMSQGFSYETFAAKISVSRNALYVWEKEHPEWKEAKDIAQPKLHHFWEVLHLEGAKGEREVNANLVMFALKNHNKWKDRIEQEISHAPPIFEVRGPDGKLVERIKPGT